MPIYRYQHESLVDVVHILTNEKGGLRAYLYADDGKDSDRLRTLKQSLRAQGYKCVPTLYDGKPVLEVRGFNKADELMGYLDGMRALTGKPEVVAAEGDVRSRKSKLSNGTLKFAGYSYNVGDAAYMYYSAGPVFDKLKDPAKRVLYLAEENKSSRFFDGLGIVSGIGYALGSFCLTFFGSKDQSINTITAATSKVERFARTQGYQIAPESSIAFVNHEPKRTAWESLKHTIGRYPSESLNSIYVGVGLCLSAASFYHATRIISRPLASKILEEKGVLALEEGKRLAEAERLADKDFVHNKKMQKWDKIDVGLGAVTATSAILGLTVKEQKRLEGDPKRHGIGGVIDWIKEKPLRATGIGYGIATGFHAVATYGKWTVDPRYKEDTKYLKGRVIFIAANVISEAMLFMSSKGHGVGIKPDKSINDSVISAAAELVLRQPQEKREAVINQLSGYIASPEVLAIHAAEVEKSIRQNIAELDKNPWTKHYVSTEKGDVLEVVQTPDGQAKVVTPDETPAETKPTNVVSSPEYVAKQHAGEHALA